MPDKPTDRIRRLLQTARQAVKTLSSTLDELEEQLAGLEQEAATQVDYLVPDDQAEVPQLTPEELEIASVKMLLTFQEAAGLLGVPVAAVRDMVGRGELPVFKLGRTVRIPRKHLEEYISEDGRPSLVEEEITVPKKEKAKEHIQKNHAAQVIHRDKKARQKTNAPDSKDETSLINKKPLLTVEEAAVILRLHKISVYRLISAKKLPSCRIGQAIRIPTKALEEHIEAVRAGEREG